MALATRCPYCRTTFRVTHDQLKLRGGLVRCGACKEIFSGVENLLPAQPGSQASDSAMPGLASGLSREAGAAAPALPPATSTVSHRNPGAEESANDGANPDGKKSANDSANDSIKESAYDSAQGSAYRDFAASSGADHFKPTSTAGQQADAQLPAQDALSSSDEAAASLPGQDGAPPAPAGEHRDTLPPTPPQQDIDPLTRMTLMDMRPWPQAEDDAAGHGAGSEASRLADGAHTGGDAFAHGDKSGTDGGAYAHGYQAGATDNTSAADGNAAPETDEIDRALGELQQKPWRGTTETDHDAEDADAIDALDNEEPDFVRQARLQEQRRHKTRLIFGFGSALLLALALLQTTILMRTEIAARWPASLAAINDICSVFGCKTGLPQRIEYVTIESHELQALPDSDNAFVLSTLLRNRSGTVQAWPHLELTLNDAGQQPVARRVLAPADYLPAPVRARGMAPSSEKPVRVSFSLSQLKASGYQLYVFYP